MTLHLDLTPDLEHYVAQKVEAGTYSSADDFVLAGLRSLKEHEEEHDSKVATLRAAIQEGIESGMAKGDVFARVRRETGLPPRQKQLP